MFLEVKFVECVVTVEGLNSHDHGDKNCGTDNYCGSSLSLCS